MPNCPICDEELVNNGTKYDEEIDVYFCKKCDEEFTDDELETYEDEEFGE